MSGKDVFIFFLLLQERTNEKVIPPCGIIPPSSALERTAKDRLQQIESQPSSLKSNDNNRPSRTNKQARERTTTTTTEPSDEENHD